MADLDKHTGVICANPANDAAIRADYLLDTRKTGLKQRSQP